MANKKLLELLELMELVELIGLAAKAIHLVYIGDSLAYPVTYKYIVDNWDPVTSGRDKYAGIDLIKWNPLTDDGDALRLAVNLGISINPVGEAGNDAYAATRRAIVLAAAEIGKKSA